MAGRTGRLRAELKESHPPSERRELIREVVRSPAVWKALHTGIAKAEYEAATAMGQDERGSENG